MMNLRLSKTLSIGIIAFSILFNSNCKKKETPVEPEPAPAPAAPSPLPVITTGTVTSISSASALCGGEVTSEGSSLLAGVGVCWDTQPGPTLLRSHTSDGAGVGKFESKITGLQPNTTYFVRAYASNQQGTSYGNEISFKTAAEWETVISGQNSLDQFSALVPLSNSLLLGTRFGIGTSVDGKIWSNFSSFPAQEFVTQIARDGNTLVVPIYYKDIYMSGDLGSTWQKIAANVQPDQVAVKGNTVFAYYGGMLHSTKNSGQSWDTLSKAPADAGGAIYYSDNTLLITSASVPVSKSTDLGKTFSVATGMPPNTWVAYFYEDGTNIYACSSIGLFVSSDKGNTWTATGPSGNPANTIIRAGNKLFAAYNNGMWQSPDGKTWTKTEPGLPGQSNVSSLAVYKGFLYAAHYDGRLYRLPLN